VRHRDPCRELPDGLSVAELLAAEHIAPREVAVEVNLELVPRSLYPSRRLAEGDAVEIVRFVGGG
jgi:sulfur carrier protein